MNAIKLSTDQIRTIKKMRTSADALTTQIEKKMNPATAKQNPTPRRASIIASMFEDGQRMAQIQNVLYGLADHIETGTVPPPLRGVKSREDVHQLLFGFAQIYSEDFANRIHRAAHNIAIQMSGAEYYEEKRRKMELYQRGIDLIGVVPGYFPTPMKIGKALIDWAGVIDDAVFDPSAGGGAILDAVLNYLPGVERHGIEQHHTLAALCQEKSHQVYQGDIFNTPITRQYKFILMNPPFEDDADCRHIMYVYDNWLAPGGVLVSVTGAGAFFHKTKIAQTFQDFVASRGEWEELPAGSFKESKTGVNTCIVRLEK